MSQPLTIKHWAGKMPRPPSTGLLGGCLLGGQDATPSQCRLAGGDDVMITEKVNRFLIRMCRYILNERKVRGFG